MFLDALKAISLVEEAHARIFERKLHMSPSPDPPPPTEDMPIEVQFVHRRLEGGGVWKYLSKNAKYYPRRRIKF